MVWARNRPELNFAPVPGPVPEPPVQSCAVTGTRTGTTSPIMCRYRTGTKLCHRYLSRKYAYKTYNRVNGPITKIYLTYIRLNGPGNKIMSIKII